MNQAGPRFWKIFFEVYENLPRQGPGNRACASRALGLCHDLGECPAILDLGCGVGGQTLQLAELTSGSIVAIDSHAPSIERLQAVVAERGLAQRVRAMVGNMARPEQPFGVFDLIWSEGALLQHRASGCPSRLPWLAATWRLSGFHRCDLAPGEPAACGQGRVRYGLSDHGMAG